MASNPGLGAYIQAQKRQKQIEDQLAKAHKDDDDSKKDDDGHGSKSKDGGKGTKDEHKEDQNTVGALAKTVAKEVIGTVKAVTRTEDPGETMDGSVARIVQFSDSDDDEPKLKPRPAPQLPPKHGDQLHDQRPEHRNVLGKRVAEGLGALGRWAPGMRHSPLQLSTGQTGVRRVKHLWYEQAAPRLQQAYSGITLSFVIKLAVLWLLRRRVPKAVPFLELTSLAIPLTEALAHWRMPHHKWPAIPQPAAQGLQVLRTLATPLLVLDCAAALHRLCSRQPQQPTRGPLLPETLRRARRVRTRGARTPRTPKRLTFQGDAEPGTDSPVTPSRLLGGLSELPPRGSLRRSRSMGGTPRDKSTPRAMRTPRAGEGQPLTAASARLITSVLLFLSFMLAMLQRNFWGRSTGSRAHLNDT